MSLKTEQNLNQNENRTNQRVPKVTAISDEFGRNLKKVMKYLNKRNVQYVEIRNAKVKGEGYKRIGKFSNRGIREVKNLMNEFNMEVSALGSPLCNGAPPADQSERLRIEDEIKRYLEIADMLNVKHIRVFYFRPNPRNLEPNYEDPSSEFYKQYQEVIEFFKELGDLAGEHEVNLCLENEPGLFGDRPSNIERFIKDVNSKWVGALLDPGNMYKGRIDAKIEEFAKVYSITNYAHIKDVKISKPATDERKYTVNGKGMIPYVEIFKGLLDSGYDSFFSVETHMHGRRWKNSVNCLNGLIDLLGKAGWNISQFRRE